MTSVVSPRVRTRMPVAQRRIQILDAATSLIGQRGYFGLAIQDVAHACGLTVPGVLHHFPSKDDLLLAVLGHRDREDLTALTAELGGGLDHAPLSAAEADRVCAAVVRRNAGQPELVRLFVVLGAEAVIPGHPAHDFFRTRRQTTSALFAAAFRELDDHPQLLARRVMALMDGLQLQWLEADGDLDLEDEWKRMSRGIFERTRH